MTYGSLSWTSIGNFSVRLGSFWWNRSLILPILHVCKGRRYYIFYFFSFDPEGDWKNCQRVLKFLPLIFGSETSKQLKWVRNVRVDYWHQYKLESIDGPSQNLTKSSENNWKFYRFTPKTTHVSTIQIFNLKCSKSKALNDFLQTNSNSTHWVVFGVTVSIMSMSLSKFQPKSSHKISL